MRYAIIENNLVINTVISESPLDENWILSDYAKIGDSYINNVFIAPPAPPEAIPTLTMRQARLALLVNNLLSQVEAAITTAEHRIWWDYSTTVERNNPLVCGVLDSLGMSANEIDALFVEAARL